MVAVRSRASHDPARPGGRRTGCPLAGVALRGPTSLSRLESPRPAVEAVEQFARPVAVAALADHLVEQGPGLLVVARRQGALRFLQLCREHALRLHGQRAGLLESAAGGGVLGIEEEDPPEEIRRLAAPLLLHEAAPLVEEAADPVSLETRQIA